MADEHASSVESRWIARILRDGLLTSLALMVASLALWLAHGGGEARRVGVADLAHVDAASGVALAGLFVLAATPALRVVGLAVLWARERDRRFVAVAVAVGVVLAVATLLGGA